MPTSVQQASLELLAASEPALKLLAKVPALAQHLERAARAGAEFRPSDARRNGRVGRRSYRLGRWRRLREQIRRFAFLRLLEREPFEHRRDLGRGLAAELRHLRKEPLLLPFGHRGEHTRKRAQTALLLNPDV